MKKTIELCVYSPKGSKIFPLKSHAMLYKLIEFIQLDFDGKEFLYRLMDSSSEIDKTNSRIFYFELDSDAEYYINLIPNILEWEEFKRERKYV